MALWNKRERSWKRVYLYVGLLLLAACSRPSLPPPATPTPEGTPLLISTDTPVPTAIRLSTRTATPTPTEIPVPPSPSAYPSPTPWPSGIPTPVPTLVATPSADEAEAVLWEYILVRKEAEETLNPELLKKVCMDPYLSWKTERIRENIRDNSHWETRSVQFVVTRAALLLPCLCQLNVRVHKIETKLYYPAGSSVPDDEICQGPIYSYRDCAYAVDYTLIWDLDEGRWKIAQAQALGDCPGKCYEPALTPVPTSTSTPAPTATVTKTPTRGSAQILGTGRGK